MGIHAWSVVLLEAYNTLFTSEKTEKPLDQNPMRARDSRIEIGTEKGTRQEKESLDIELLFLSDHF